MTLAEGGRSRSFIWEDPAAMAAIARKKPGLEYLREIAASELAPPPVAPEAAGGYSTTDLRVRYVRAMRNTTGRVLAEARVVHLGRRTATAEGRLYVQADESLIAHASTGCAILR